jgi:hypothetical protein
MVEQLLLLFQALFLVLLYLFIWRVVRTASRDLRLPQESFLLSPAQAQAHGFPVTGETPTQRLVVSSSPALESGHQFALGLAPITIGRSGENAIAIAGDDYASARHARIEPLRDGLWLVDLGSTNGTYLNGHQVTSREQLHEGDLIRVGNTELRVESDRQGYVDGRPHG